MTTTIQPDNPAKLHRDTSYACASSILNEQSKMNKCGIYAIINMVNGKIYIGSSACIFHRWEQHKQEARSGKHKNDYFQKAWKKYGESAFEFRIIEECPETHRLPREDYWIIFHHSDNDNHGYNLQKATSIVHSKETRKKISLALSGRSKTKEHRLKISNSHMGHHISEETKRKISLTTKGVNNHFYGKHHSEETRRKISELAKMRFLKRIEAI